eukprot:314333-Chlamydomonas_euryale.AAC.1
MSHPDAPAPPAPRRACPPSLYRRRTQRPSLPFPHTPHKSEPNYAHPGLVQQGRTAGDALSTPSRGGSHSALLPSISIQASRARSCFVVVSRTPDESVAPAT